MPPQALTPHSPLRMEHPKIPIPPKKNFMVFIKPENIADRIEKTVNRANITYIPNINNNNSNFIFLLHNTRYSIGVLNHSNNDCNADIFIDGTHHGTFRVLKNTSSFRLERPLDTNKSFNFISKNSEEAIISDKGNDNSPNLGEILVQIRPEDTTYSRQQSTIYAAATAGLKVETDSCDIADGSKSIQTADSEGFTVLGSCTTQTFKHAPYMHTNGLHTFLYKLVVGDPDLNTIFFINN